MRTVASLFDGLPVVRGEVCKNDTKLPLVSIILLSYNNSEFLAEAIDSIVTQDYPNIELIVSDDGSSSFCSAAFEQYLLQNASALSACAINVNSENIGTVAHCAEMLKYASGEIVQMLAADDALASTTVISEIVRAFSEGGEELQVITTQIEMRDRCLDELISPFLSLDDIELLQRESPTEVFERLAQSCFIAAPGTFYRRQVLEFADELCSNYRLIEDYPIYCRLSRDGVVIRYIDIVSALHRAGGVSQTGGAASVKSLFLRDKMNVLSLELFPYIDEASTSFLSDLTRTYDHTAKQLSSCRSLLDCYGIDRSLMNYMQMSSLFYAMTCRRYEKRLSEERGRNRALRRTVSWRLTKPLRSGKRLVKKRLARK